MSEPIATIPAVVRADDYLARCAENFYEWVNGKVIDLRPFTTRQLDCIGYVRSLLDTYLALNPIGHTRQVPFLMWLDLVKVYREPDLQVILNSNPFHTEMGMIGPADICIEVVSPESVERDYGTKFVEYETGGVKEYWIIDPIRSECRLCRLNAEGRYQTQQPDGEGCYHTPLLPGLSLRIPTLWEDQYPEPPAIVDAVKAMLAK